MPLSHGRHVQEAAKHPARGKAPELAHSKTLARVMVTRVREASWCGAFTAAFARTTGNQTSGTFARAKAVLKPSHSKRFARLDDYQLSRQRLGLRWLRKLREKVSLTLDLTRISQFSPRILTRPSATRPMNRRSAGLRPALGVRSQSSGRSSSRDAAMNSCTLSRLQAGAPMAQFMAGEQVRKQPFAAGPSARSVSECGGPPPLWLNASVSNQSSKLRSARFPARISKGFRLKAQDCEERATLGNRQANSPTRKGLRPVG